MPQEGVIRRSDMDTDTTYLLCPDSGCKGFSASRFPCEDHCPKVKDLVKIIRCIGCGGVIELSGSHNGWARVDHHCPSDRVCMNLSQRMSGKYRRLYQRPLEDK